MNAKTIFRPGQGSVINRYTAAIADGAMYPGDWVMLSATAPGSQGVSGAVGGKTLGAADYVECSLSDSTTTGNPALALGVLAGKSFSNYSITSDVSGGVLADQDLATIQTYGIAPLASVASGGAAREFLIMSTVAGEASNVLSAAAGITGDTVILGTQMAASGTYTRATPTTNDGAICWVKCD